MQYYQKCTTTKLCTHKNVIYALSSDMQEQKLHSEEMSTCAVMSFCCFWKAASTQDESTSQKSSSGFEATPDQSRSKNANSELAECELALSSSSASRSTQAFLIPISPARNAKIFILATAMIAVARRSQSSQRYGQALRVQKTPCTSTPVNRRCSFPEKLQQETEPWQSRCRKPRAPGML